MRKIEIFRENGQDPKGPVFEENRDFSKNPEQITIKLEIKHRLLLEGVTQLVWKLFPTRRIDKIFEKIFWVISLGYATEKSRNPF